MQIISLSSLTPWPILFFKAFLQAASLIYVVLWPSSLEGERCAEFNTSYKAMNHADFRCACSIEMNYRASV